MGLLVYQELNDKKELSFSGTDAPASFAAEPIASNIDSFTFVPLMLFRWVRVDQAWDPLPKWSQDQLLQADMNRIACRSRSWYLVSGEFSLGLWCWQVGKYWFPLAQIWVASSRPRSFKICKWNDTIVGTVLVTYLTVRNRGRG